MEGRLAAELSNVVLHPLPDPRNSRTPWIDRPREKVRLPEDRIRNVDPNLFPEGTCTECQQTLHSVLKTRWSPGRKCGLGHDGDLPTDCPICKLIFDSLRLGYWTTGFVHLKLKVRGLQPIIKVLYFGGQNYRDPGFKGQFRIYAEQSSYASKFVPYWRAPSSNFSDTTFQNIARRIKSCDETHTRCRNLSAQFPELTPQYLPSRVIHVGSETRQPHLHITQEQHASRYVALSHCWGNIPQVRTLKRNIERYKKSIVFESLSKTFQDALHVTRRLGIEFIWIDSLCIVQDDEEDWLRESKNMGSIYTNAYITIAATSATNGNDGLDSARPVTNWIRLPCDGRDEDKGHMWLTDASWTPQSDLYDAPLNTRGWVLQEKILSRRILHFASSQVYWECKKHFLGEESDCGIEVKDTIHQELSKFWTHVNAIPYPTHPKYLHSHCNRPITRRARKQENAIPYIGQLPVERTNDLRTGYAGSQLGEFYECWRALVIYYCARKFTETRDRMMALLGIIQVVEKQTGLSCVDGHWDDGSWRFVYELLWFPKGPKVTPLPYNIKLSRLCSSWSWASLEGEVEFSTIRVSEDLSESFYDWVDYRLKLMAIGSKVHVPWECHPLKVSGMLRASHKGKFRGDIHFTGEVYVHPRERAFRIVSEAMKEVHGFVCFDWEGEEPEHFYLSPVHMSEETVCLVLVERNLASIMGRCFERVGIGYILGVNSCGVDSCTSRECADRIYFEACEREIFYII